MKTPRFSKCASCGAEIVHEFGVLDGAAYRDGVVQRHICEVELPAPMNEREWNELQARNVELAPPPPVAKPRPRPKPHEEGGHVGGIKF